mgnify:CR=1 FL=1
MLEDFEGELLALAIILLGYLIYLNLGDKQTTEKLGQTLEKLDNLRDKIAGRDEVDLTSIEKAKDASTLDLEKIRMELKQLEKLVNQEKNQRTEAYGGIKNLVNDLNQRNKEMNVSVGKLSSAMKNNTERGEWGEVQLDNVITISGMAHRIDYDKEKNFKTKSGEQFRADAIVNMPGGRGIIIDAKAPNIFSDSNGPNQLTLDGIYNEEDPKKQKTEIKKYTSALSVIIKKLSNKKYHEIIDEDSGLNLSPDFIVLFLPGENMLQIALKEDTKMWEKAAKNKVILASPYILLALLKSIFMSWRDRERDENVKTILSVSDEVVDRVEILMKHLNKTQESIKNTVTSWNNAISSYENRLQKTRVRLQELKEDNETLTELDKVEDSPNKLE